MGGRREEDPPGHDRASSQADTKRYLHFWSLSVSQLSVVTLFFRLKVKIISLQVKFVLKQIEIIHALVISYRTP